MTAIEQHLSKFGEIGSADRLREIARMDLGDRSLAARRVLWKRASRLNPQIKIFINQ